MIVRTSMVLVVAGTLFTLVGAFAPVANLGAAATPTSLYQIVGGLLGWKVGAPAIPASLQAIELRLLGGAGLLAVAAFLAIALSVFKFLRSSLVPSMLMTAVAGYLMFTISGIRDVAVVVPDSYGWILLIAGSLMATVTSFFMLFGPGQDEAARLKTMTEAQKKRGRLPFEVETTSHREPIPAPEPPKPEPAKPAKADPAKPEPSKPAKAEAPKRAKADKPTASDPPPPSAPPAPGKPKVPPPKRDAPKPQRLSEAPKAQAPKAPTPKAQSPKVEPPKPADPSKASKPAASADADASKPAAPKPAGDDAVKAGVPDLTPDTLAPMPASGYSGEEPTESGGWVLSGFDANGMAVRLNISDVDLRAAEDGIVIGRSAKYARLVLNDDSVSRRHARLSGRSPLTIEDLDSANGTVVNREMLTPGDKVPIEPGVAIEIGAVRLTLVRS